VGNKVCYILLRPRRWRNISRLSGRHFLFLNKLQLNISGFDIQTGHWQISETAFDAVFNDAELPVFLLPYPERCTASEKLQARHGSSWSPARAGHSCNGIPNDCQVFSDTGCSRVFFTSLPTIAGAVSGFDGSSRSVMKPSSTTYHVHRQSDQFLKRLHEKYNQSPRCR
jgi:hypothetical protein